MTDTPAQTDALANRTIARAAEAFLTALDAEPEKDCWDTETGEEEPGARQFSSDWALTDWHEARDAALASLRAALAAKFATLPAHPDALAKLAEIPTAGSEERERWSKMIEQQARHEWPNASTDPLIWTLSEKAILTLMSEARKQGQRDALAAFPDGDGWEPIETADPPLDDVSVDLPNDAREGLGWAVCDVSGEFAYHTWWAYEGKGVSKVTHWRRPIAGPTAALATGGARHD